MYGKEYLEWLESNKKETSVEPLTHMAFGEIVHAKYGRLSVIYNDDSYQKYDMITVWPYDWVDTGVGICISTECIKPRFEKVPS